MPSWDSMSTRESLISALSEAAEIEHSITCQYLFAAFSLKTHPCEGGTDWLELEQIRKWKTEILRIAREEMAHNGLVSNLLIVVGGAPQLRHAHFPHPVHHCAPYDRFELLPFGDEALERFVSYERSHATPVPGSPPSIGGLYHAIRETLLRAGPEIFVGPAEHQILNRHLRIGEGQFDIDLAAACDHRSAAALIDRIVEHDHHERFVTIQEELRVARACRPGFEPARPVGRNPRVYDRANVAGTTTIRHPVTRTAAHLFNVGYEAMILMLTRLYGRADESPAEVDALLHMAFFPMMTVLIRPLGEMLTQMPAEPSCGVAAGPCFERPLGLSLQANKHSAWVVLHERLRDIATLGRSLVSALDQSTEAWTEPLEPRAVLLAENLERMAQRFRSDMNIDSERIQRLLERLR